MKIISNEHLQPEPAPGSPDPRCLDNGHDGPSGRRATTAYGCPPPIRGIGGKKQASCYRRRRPTRRRVVDIAPHCLSKFHGTLIRYEKDTFNYFGITKLACALLWIRHSWWSVISRQFLGTDASCCDAGSCGGSGCLIAARSARNELHCWHSL